MSADRAGDRARPPTARAMPHRGIHGATIPRCGIRVNGQPGRPDASGSRPGETGSSSGPPRSGSGGTNRQDGLTGESAEAFGAFEAKTRLSELLRKLAQGRVYCTARRGKPVAEGRRLAGRGAGYATATGRSYPAPCSIDRSGASGGARST